MVTIASTEQTGSTALTDPSRPARPADRLLATATRLFAANGIRAIGVDRILRESGCAKASLYSTYGSKESLVIAYLTQLDLADRILFEQAAEQQIDPVEKALTFFDLARAKGLRNEFPGCLYANAALLDTPWAYGATSVVAGPLSGPKFKIERGA